MIDFSLRDILIPVLAAMIVLVAIIIAVTLVMGPATDKFNTQDAYIQQCLASERYTREECLLLANVECR